jgi:hypothetical protein
MQSTQRAIERRTGRRESAAFAMRYHRDGGEAWTGAWVVDLSPSGAAFLAMDENAPQVGDQLELDEFAQRDPGMPQAGSALPRRARVTRIDDLPGLTRKIAVAFELAKPILTR